MKKKTYVKPEVINMNLETNAAPVALVAGLEGIAGLAAGYAAIRAVTNAIKAMPIQRLPKLNEMVIS